MLKQFPKDVKLVFKNLPLTKIHKFAMSAATAALAAHEQGKFWEYHDKLFENYNQITDQLIVDIAGQIGLDKTRFEADRKNAKIQQQINNDMKAAADSNVTGTPSIFINGRLLKQRSPEGIKQAVETELANLAKTKK